MAKKKNKKNKVDNLKLDTHMSNNEFYAEFGQHMLCVIGEYLERFYKFTNEIIEDKWNKKEKKELKFIIKTFKSCGSKEDRSNIEYKQYIKQVDKAIDLFKKHWFNLWN